MPYLFDRPAETCIIFNPHSGRGRARRFMQSLPIHGTHGPSLRPTSRAGDGLATARQAIADGFRIIVAAGGDGTVHEVANGMLQADQPDAIFVVWPIGSANDFAHALGLTEAWERDRSERLETTRVDVGVVSGGGRSRYYVDCLGIGFNSAVTYESRQIRWLRGAPLYTLASLRALLWHFDQPMLRVQFDDTIRENATLALSINLGPREGNFPVTPKACLDDGWFDAIHAGPLTRWQALKLLPRMISGTLPADHPHMWIGRCKRVTVQSLVPLRIHVDGEFFCHPEDGIREVRIELRPRTLQVAYHPRYCRSLVDMNRS